MPSSLKAKNLAQLFLATATSFEKKPAFATQVRKGIFEATTYGTWCERALALATGLIELGVHARDHVGLFSDNCLEWIVADAAVLFCGAADVPRGSDITSAEMSYISNHADVKILFLENQKLLTQWHNLGPSRPDCSWIILMKSDTLPEGVMTLTSLEALGKRLRDQGDRRVEERIAQLQPEDLYTIIYTSGTTGTPKGVQLTHASMCSQVKHLAQVLLGDQTPNKLLSRAEPLRALSILPIWHSYERVFEMFVISQGGCTTYSSLRTLAHDLKIVRPNVMASAPRLWEMLYEKIMAEVARQSAFKQRLFQLVMSWKCLADLFRRWNIPPLPHLQNIVGGALRATISGGGALPPYVDHFFNRIGIAVLEGYGLTESGPVIAVRTPEQLVIGTVGPLLPETEIKIIDLENGRILYPDPTMPNLGAEQRGEICVRGPQIMTGYYKNSEGTQQALRENWLHTGDIGMITMKKSQRPFSIRAIASKKIPMLKIVGRCKETIVLLNGENVEPLPIESRLLQSPLIAQCIVVGQDQKQLGLLIVPARDAASEQTTDPQKQQELFQLEIRRLISSENGFKSFEKIGPWRLLLKPFEVGDELTNTYKLKRHLIAERYASLIEEMFKGREAAV